jgi:hypothetical protein
MLENNKVYVKWNPLHERVVCVHSRMDEECELCKEAYEALENTPYFLHGEWFSVGGGSKLCYCGNEVDKTNPDCVKLDLCSEHAMDS